MTDLEKAARQALDALKKADKISGYVNNNNKTAIKALEAALNQQQAEPVAWRIFDGEGGYDYRTYDDNEDFVADWRRRNPRHENWLEPLYTTPQQAVLEKDWPQAKPIAWMVYTEDGKSVYVTDNPTDINPSQRALPLFATPQQVKPELVGLTNKEIYDCWPRSNEPIAIARAIEAAFKEKNT